MKNNGLDDWMQEKYSAHKVDHPHFDVDYNIKKDKLCSSDIVKCFQCDQPCRVTSFQADHGIYCSMKCRIAGYHQKEMDKIMARYKPY